MLGLHISLLVLTHSYHKLSLLFLFFDVFLASSGSFRSIYWDNFIVFYYYTYYQLKYHSIEKKQYFNMQHQAFYFHYQIGEKWNKLIFTGKNFQISRIHDLVKTSVICLHSTSRAGNIYMRSGHQVTHWDIIYQLPHMKDQTKVL